MAGKNARLVAFLRAINVGGHVVTMDRLKRVFEDLGFRDVETFIASGNVIFTAKAKDGYALERKIERALETALGYEVRTFVRTGAEVGAIPTAHAFGRAQVEKAALFNVGFLAARPAAGDVKKLGESGTAGNRFEVRGKDVYWLSTTKLSASKLSYTFFEKTLGTAATFRGMNTVTRLAAKYGFGAP